MLWQELSDRLIYPEIPPHLPPTSFAQRSALGHRFK
jgi:hypothetical protein